MNGKIPYCPHNGCAFVCCTFQQGNYIVMLPDEWETTPESYRQHLAVIDPDYHGGKKVTCHAADTATCDGGYKPLDCRMYPFWPRVDSEGAVDGMIKGKKCPLHRNMIQEHEIGIRVLVQRLTENDPALIDFFNSVEMVGYENEPDDPGA